MINQNPTETRIASVYRDDNEIITITLKNCNDVDEFDVVDLNLVIRHKAHHKAAYKLVITVDEFDLSQKAKEMAAREENISQTKARAIVVSSQLKASVQNFFKQFSSRSYPQQFFSSEKEAYAWLRDLKGNSL